MAEFTTSADFYSLAVENPEMSPLAQRGRLFFVSLATLIVLDRGFAILRALTGDAAHFRFLSSVLLPAVIIFMVASLWQGDARRRHFRALILLVYGGGNLLNYGRVLYAAALEAQPWDAGLFLQVSLSQMGLPILHASCYVLVSAALFFSTSLRAFFDYQSQTAETRRGAPENESGPRFPVLTRAILESLDDGDLVGAVHDYVSLKVHKDYTNRFAIVSSLPRGFQAVYSTWWVAAEVSNGGFHQYFYNQGTDWAFMALEGYKLFGAHETAALMARAIEVYLLEETERLVFPDVTPAQMIDGFVKSREASKLPELDRLFYETRGGGATEYIKAHLDEFVGD
jgi:hypothetical protein